MSLSDADQWALFGAVTFIILVSLALWVKYLPRYRQYKKKSAKLDKLNDQYEELRKRRKDLVFHYYWSVDSGNLKDADKHEVEVLEIDERIGKIRETYSEIESGGA